MKKKIKIIEDGKEVITNNKLVKKSKEKVKKEIAKRGLKNFLWSCIFVLLIAGATIFLIFALYIIISAPNFDKNKLYSKEATVIYDKDGNEFARIGSQNRELIEYEDLPQIFIDALLATEDSRFFQHNGLDVARFIKATAALGKSGGASTITMQLVKNIYTDNTATGIKGIIRKFTDIYMAVFKIENCYTKEEILEFYVNSLWMGSDGSLNYDGIWGIETASEYYFGKSVSELSLAESSLLVGMYQNARLYNPYKNPVGCRNRQEKVLTYMVNHGYITKNEKEIALSIPIESLLVENGDVIAANDNQAAVDYIIDEVINQTGKDPRKSPMEIYSTIDSHATEVLSKIDKGESFKFQVSNVDEEGNIVKNIDQEAVAITSIEDGSVVAISGGRNYVARGFNRAVSKKMVRQPGSTAKPLFDYGPLIEYLNASTGDYFFDEPDSYSDGTTMNNWDGKYQGMINMRTALVNSRNIPAMQVFKKVSSVDKSYIEKFVKSVGIHYGEALYESASIGGFNGVNPLEMSAAYATFARGGVYIEPYVITKIVFEDGTKYEYKPTKTKVLSEETSYMISDMLKGVARDDGIYVNGTDIAAKTGTTNVAAESVEKLKLPEDIIMDTWIISYSPEYSSALWYGYDDLNSENYMTIDSGWYARTRIMGNIATNIYSTNKTFKRPSTVISVEVEKNTIPLQLPSAYTPEDMRITELFKEGTEPTETSNRYQKLSTPTNVKSTAKNNIITITWDEIDTPKAIDKNYLQNYYDENYGKFASKYYENRLAENNEQFGRLGYNIYQKNSNGELTLISWVSTPTYSQSIEKSKNYTFVIKSAYEKFSANASDGVPITIKGNKDNTDKDTEKKDTTDEKPKQEFDDSLD